MMKVYRRNPAMTRLGSVIATGLVGGGLMLTASNGIAAETSKQVEEQVRTVLAPVVPAVAPAPMPAPAAVAAPLPPAAKVAMLGHPHPVAPVPPVPPVTAVPPTPPAPPVPPRVHGEAWIDHAELSREIHEAMRESQRDIAEAQREAMAARHEALIEAREARREALRAGEEGRRAGEEARRAGEQARAQALAATRACSASSHSVSVQVEDRGGKAVVRCHGWSEKEKAEFRQTMIASLQRARASIASMDRHHMPEHAREKALESVDRQLQRLREGK